MKPKEKSTFAKNLRLELSNCVPIIPGSRLEVYNRRYQWDPEVDSKQILLKFKILPGKKGEITFDTIQRTLDEMIRNRDITPISRNPSTAMLDSNYGFVHKSMCYIPNSLK